MLDNYKIDLDNNRIILSNGKEKIYKLAGSSTTISALNRPENWEEINMSNSVVEASMNKNNADLGGFDLKKAVSQNPDNLFVKIFAIKADEVNDNGDYFCESELKKAAKTFIGVPIFCNHQNDDIEKARGSCVHAWYDDKSHGIYIIARVDKVAYPKLARAIETGIIVGSSMGAAVEASLCSVCHKAAATAEDYCSHLTRKKNRQFSGEVKCEYHNSDIKVKGYEDECPICGSKKDNIKKIAHKDQQVFEHNYGVNFIEDSFVVNPACHSCLVQSVLYAPGVNQKIAELKDFVTKLSSEVKGCGKEACASNSKMVKEAGQVELEKLTQAMSDVEFVSTSLLAQKDEVDVAFVQSLIEAMGKIQETKDDLIRQGYASLASPSLDNKTGDLGVTPNTEIREKVDTQPTFSGATTESMDDLGRVTMPKSSENILNNKKDYLKRLQNIKDSISKYHNDLSLASSEAVNAGDILESKSYHEFTNGNSRIVISSSIDSNNMFIYEFNNDDLVKCSSLNDFDSEMQEIIKHDPQKAGSMLLSSEYLDNTNDKLLQSNNKELNKTMSTEKQNKTAGIGKDPINDESQTSVITEGQMKDTAPDQNPRKDSPSDITEAQLGGSVKVDNQTTTESPTQREGNPDVITEGQFQSYLGDEIIRVEDSPEVITEGQWTEASKAVKAALPGDWAEQITESQLRDLLEDHRFVNSNPIYDTITEGQLSDKPEGIKRWANKNYMNLLTKVASNALADAMVNFHKSPKEIKVVLSEMQDKDSLKQKMAFASVINALPIKETSRELVIDNNKYWNKQWKQASSNHIDTRNAIAIAVADNAVSGFYAKDIFDAMSQITSNKMAMSNIDELVQNKLASDDGTDVDINKFAAISEAINEMSKPKDRRVRIMAALEDIGIEPTEENKVKFVEASKKVAQQEMGVDSPVIILKINVDPENGTVTLDAISEEDATEDMVGADAEFMGGLGEVEEMPLETEEEIETTEDEEIETVEDGDIDNDNEVDTEEDEEIEEDEDEEIEDEDYNYAKNKNGKVKTAQFGMPAGGGGAPGQDMAGAGAPGMMNEAPMPPAGESQGVESLQTDASPEDLIDEGGMETSEPQPPGSLCPVCGSSDVDLVESKGKCNNCTSEFIIKIDIEVLKWAGLMDESSEEEVMEGEGFEMEDDQGFQTAASASPFFAVVTKITPDKLNKLASILDTGDEDNVDFAKYASSTGIKKSTLEKLSNTKYELGCISPITGSYAKSLGNGNYRCLDSGSVYKVKVAEHSKEEGAFVVEWVWKPEESLTEACSDCSEIKKAFVNALSDTDYDLNKFKELVGSEENIKKASNIILNLKKSGSMKTVKTASVDDNVLDNYKYAQVMEGEKFPIEEMREVLARRYGLNAVALSGPCEGQNIVDCVTKAMKRASICSNNVAIKVADVWLNNDGCDDCITDRVRSGLSAKEAATVCEVMKHIYASSDEILADKIAQLMEELPEEDMDVTVVEEETEFADDIDDVFGDTVEVGEDGEVTLRLPASVVEQVDRALDEAMGENPDEETHHQDVPEGDVEVELTTEEASNLDEDLGESLDEEVVEEMDEDVPGEPEDTELAEEINVDGQYVEGEEEEVEDDVDEIVQLGSAMHSRIGKVENVSLLDMDLLRAQLLGKEAQSKKIKHKNVQDATDEFGQYSDGSTMGHEDETVATETENEVVRDDQRMGGEKDNAALEPNKDETPEVPSAGDSATMGKEKEQGYTSDTPVDYTGGDEGSGHDEDLDKKASNNYRTRLNGLADNLREQLNKQAEMGKLNDPKPVSEDKDITPPEIAQPTEKGQTMGHEDDTVVEAKEPENTEDSQVMGHEEEILGGKPEDTTEVPTDDERMGNEKNMEELKPEKQKDRKGTVIARGDEESESRIKEATRVAVEMCKANLLKSEDVHKKVAELSQYKISQIKDIEKAMYSGRKGFAAVSEGLEKPLVIDAESSVKEANKSIGERLSSAFTLSKRVQSASEDSEIAARRNYRR